MNIHLKNIKGNSDIKKAMHVFNMARLRSGLEVNQDFKMTYSDGRTFMCHRTASGNYIVELPEEKSIE